jgi:hypothetical protein
MPRIFPRKSREGEVLEAIEGRSHLPRSQESGLGAEKRLDGTGRARAV